jgi:hypothetical protein
MILFDPMDVKTAPMKPYIDVVPADDDVILKEAGNQIGLRVSPLYTCSRSAAASSQSLSTLGHCSQRLDKLDGRNHRQHVIPYRRLQSNQRRVDTYPGFSLENNSTE